MKLTAQQLKAVGHDGNLLLQACPGSGKTRTIIARLVREIEKVRESPFCVACITYTNAAVQEIDVRVAAHLTPGDDRHYVVSTIHSFCLHSILRPFAWKVPGFIGAMNVLTRDRPEFDETVRWAVEKINYFNVTPSDLEAFANLTRDINGDPSGSAFQNAVVMKAAPHFWARCEQLGFIDFANILHKSYCLLRDHPDVTASLATKFVSFLIDEFQDTTDVQVEILRLIHRRGTARFFLVGDPYQSIFGFAGAHPELVDPFAAEIGARTDLSLSDNFRSNPAIVEHAERLFARSPPMTSEGPYKNDRLEPLFKWGDTLDIITDAFLPEIEARNIPLGRSAVLARNWQLLLPLSQRLRDFGVPIVGPGARPYRRGRLFSGLAEQLSGAVLDGYRFKIRHLERAIFHAIQDVTVTTRLDVFGYEGRMTAVRLVRCAEDLAQNDGAEYWLDHMSIATGEILNSAGWIDRQHIGLFPASVADMKNDMFERKVDIANLSINDIGIFASPDKALRLMTIHNAKGHEYEAVAIIGLRDGVLPDWRSETPEAVEAEKRLFYVGVTRAERFLMYVGEPNRFGNPPCRFLGARGVQAIAA
jgi:DNA helicase-2/ATP-dependent DNA helicase PcrA